MLIIGYVNGNLNVPLNEIKDMDEGIVIHEEAQALELLVEYEVIHLHDAFVKS